MNTTDDGTEPLGEAPELDGAGGHDVGGVVTADGQDLKLGDIADALDAAAGIVRGVFQITVKSELKLQKIAALHRRQTSRNGCFECKHCDHLWPCETARILEAVEL